MPDAASWSFRYEINSAPWDLGEPHPELVRRLDEDAGLGGTVGSALVPGAGFGEDAGALARAGWTVTAIDFAEGAGPKLKSQVEPHGGSAVIADVLGYQPVEAFDLIFDHTFFCAIEPGQRTDFGLMVERLLAPGGRFISLVFPIGKPEAQEGPPWGIDVDMIDQALTDGFRLVSASEEFTSRRRQWAQRWAVWERLG